MKFVKAPTHLFQIFSRMLSGVGKGNKRMVRGEEIGGWKDGNNTTPQANYVHQNP